MATINAARALELAREVVAEQGPDFRYCEYSGVPCFYVPLSVVRAFPEDEIQLLHLRQWRHAQNASATDPREKTGCLIGRIFDKAGFTEHRLPLHLSDNVMTFYVKYPSLMTHRTAQMLMFLQRKQDASWTWGDALAALEKEFNRGSFNDSTDD